jgi:hypothetical protein
MAASVIECTEGHYEVHKTSYGEAYVWCPEGVVVECECGHRPILSASETLCRGCGAEHAALVHEVLAARQQQRPAHPWEADYHSWRTSSTTSSSHEEYLLSEETYRLEMSRLD